MRKFTKSILTLALLMVGVTSASAGTETSIKVKDYSADGVTVGWNQKPDDASISIADGCLVIDNNQSTSGSNWDLQLHIADGFNLKYGYSYKVLITYKTTTAGGVTVALGTWGDGNSVPKYETPITVNDNFQTMTLAFDNWSLALEGCFVMWQCRSVKGIISISKVEVIEVEPDEPIVEPTLVSVITNGDLEGTDASCFSLTQPGVGGPWMATIEDGIGKEGSRGIKVVSCDQADIPACQLNPADENSYQWATQFFISSKYKLPKGTKVRLKFDYRASKAGDADIQAHGAPGAYNHWQFTGGCSFTDEWQTYDKTTTLTSDMSKADNLFYSAAFNLGKNKVGTTFYFDNIELEAGVINKETMDGFAASPAVPAIPTPSIKIGSDGIATFVANCSVKLDENVTAYAADYDEVNNSVKLNKVTEIPLHTPVIVQAASGTYPQELARVLALGTDNDLLESDGKVDADGTIYVLANKNNGPGFYKLANGEKVPTGKGYLKIASTGAPEFIGFGGDATAIKAMERAMEEGAIFDLRGQRVANAQKGIFIVNGKKVIK